MSFRITVLFLIFFQTVIRTQNEIVVTRKSLFSDSVIEVKEYSKNSKILKNTISYNFLGGIYGQHKISYNKYIKLDLAIQFTAGITKKDYLYSKSTFTDFYNYGISKFSGKKSHFSRVGYVYEIEVKKFGKENYENIYLALSFTKAYYRSIGFELYPDAEITSQNYSNIYNTNRRYNSNLTLSLGYSLPRVHKYNVEYYLGVGIRKVKEFIYEQEKTYIGNVKTEYNLNKVNNYEPNFTFGARIGLNFNTRKYEN